MQLKGFHYVTMDKGGFSGHLSYLGSLFQVRSQPHILKTYYAVSTGLTYWEDNWLTN